MILHPCVQRFLRKIFGVSLAVLVVGGASLVPAQTPYAKRLGIELDGISDGSREKPFVDVAKTFRAWMPASGGKAPVPLDEHGWPRSDAATVLFDIRPAFAWAPPIDDPDAFQPDWSGSYALRFHGQAKVEVTEDRRCRVEGLTYSEANNTSTGRVIVPRGVGLLVLAFTQTRRSPEAPVGSGIADLRLIRPGYEADTHQTFTSEFLRSLQPFAVLRYMDWLDTNHQPGYYGDRGHHALEWSNRRLPDDATQQTTGGKYGIAWEYIIELANQTGKDLWINIPVAATDDYVEQLAHMLKRDLKPNLKVYIEHSNEVWNFGFPQYTYNKLAAIDEVKRGGSSLNRDGSKDQEVWAHRRHAQRLIQISKTFRDIFGETGVQGRIRPVYASWLIFPGPYYAEVLGWVSRTHGAPKDLFYGVASGGYFNAEKASDTASVRQILDAMRASIDKTAKHRGAIRAIARRFGLKDLQYEVGPDNGGGKVANVANRIRANRDPRMKELILHDARANWFGVGGDLYMYFSHCSAYSRYGCWGLSEDIIDLKTPKWQAISDLTGWSP
jgi:hypothetical protein